MCVNMLYISVSGCGKRVSLSLVAAVCTYTHTHSFCILVNRSFIYVSTLTLTYTRLRVRTHIYTLSYTGLGYSYNYHTHVDKLTQSCPSNSPNNPKFEVLRCWNSQLTFTYTMIGSSNKVNFLMLVVRNSKYTRSTHRRMIKQQSWDS